MALKYSTLLEWQPESDLAPDPHPLVHACVQGRVVRLGAQHMLLGGVNDGNVGI